MSYQIYQCDWMILDDIFAHRYENLIIKYNIHVLCIYVWNAGNVVCADSITSIGKSSYS